MQLFDAACYLGRWPTERLAYDDVAGLLASMDRLGIERALVAHTLAWQNAPAAGNPALMEAIAGQPRLEPCWIVLPGGSPRGDLCAELAAAGVRAVRLCPRDHVYPLADWMVGDLLTALAERRYLVLVDLDQLVLPTGLFDVDPAGWRHLAWLCQTYPDLSVLLTRVGYRALRVLLPLMRACPNLCLDLSYFATHQGVEEVVAQFGAERLVFGTSQPLVDPGGAVTRLRYADLTADQQAQIASGNLQRLLARVRLPGAPASAPRPPAVVEADPAERPTPPDLADLARAGRDLRAAGIDIIDAHGHLGPYRNFDIPDSGSDGLLRVMDRCGIAITCISAHMALGPDWIAGNRLTAAAAAAHPERLIGQAVASPHEPELIPAELARAFDDLGLRALKLHPDLASYPITGEGYKPAWQFAAERRCLVLVHTFHGSRFCDPPAFGDLARRYPQVPILLVHSGAQPAAFPGAMAVARDYPNVYLDLSGSFMTGWWIARLVRELGAERVIFSSDIPFIDLRYGLGRVLFAELTPAEKALVLGGNIRRLLRLATASGR
jgi:predicted TIM-barrel fold metal-dependent hydrolase